MHIKEKLKGIDFLLKKVCANRSSVFPVKIKPWNIEMKREVKHSLDVPAGSNNNRFSIIVSDKISFHPGEGPFDIEVIVIGFVFLKEELKTSAIRAMLKDRENINFLVSQCLPHTSAAVAYLTDRMGFSPVILSPKIPVAREG